MGRVIAARLAADGFDVAVAYALPRPFTVRSRSTRSTSGCPARTFPSLDSRVTLRPGGAVRRAAGGNSTEALVWLRTLEGMLGKLGMLNTTFVDSLYPHKTFDARAHLAGTARFGIDTRIA